MCQLWSLWRFYVMSASWCWILGERITQYFVSLISLAGCCAGPRQWSPEGSRVPEGPGGVRTLWWVKAGPEAMVWQIFSDFNIDQCVGSPCSTFWICFVLGRFELFFPMEQIIVVAECRKGSPACPNSLALGIACAHFCALEPTQHEKIWPHHTEMWPTLRHSASSLQLHPPRCQVQQVLGHLSTGPTDT